MTDAIAAAAMRVRTMADGSLRIEVEVEPNDAQSAFALFGRPGARMAIAALKDGYGAKSDKPEAEKLGPLCKLAVQWCQSPKFWEWASVNGWKCTEESHARAYILHVCQVESRKELDESDVPAGLFQGLIRAPFMAWRKA